VPAVLLYRRNLFSYLEYNLNVSLLQVTIIRNLAVSGQPVFNVGGDGLGVTGWCVCVWGGGGGGGCLTLAGLPTKYDILHTFSLEVPAISSSA
jgi:hypothetical protein